MGDEGNGQEREGDALGRVLDGGGKGGGRRGRGQKWRGGRLASEG